MRGATSRNQNYRPCARRIATPDREVRVARCRQHRIETAIALDQVMMDQTRRNLLKGAAATAAAVGVGFPPIGRAAPKARVVVFGGGYGGAIAAKYLQMADPDIRVTLIEQSPYYVSCPSATRFSAASATSPA